MFRDRLSSAQHPLSSPVEKTSYSEGISICHRSSVSRSHRLHFFSANLSVHTVSGRWQTVSQRAPVGGTPLAAASPPGYVCFVYRTLHKRSRLETYRGCVYMNMNMFCVTPRCVCVRGTCCVDVKSFRCNLSPAVLRRLHRCSLL